MGTSSPKKTATTPIVPHNHTRHPAPAPTTHSTQHSISELLKEIVGEEVGEGLGEEQDRALGCLFGSMIGDALGAYCEFAREVPQHQIKKVMRMPGGGYFGLLRGQCTDDSEIAAGMLTALAHYNPDQPLAAQHYRLLECIVRQYVSWENSGPFDEGETVRKGIAHLRKALNQVKSDPSQRGFKNLFQEVQRSNQGSQSNGSLMRLAPMAFFLAIAQLEPANCQQFIKDEVRLLHPNLVLQQSSYVWVRVLVETIRRSKTDSLTFENIWKSAFQEEKKEAQLCEWFQQATGERMNAKENIGWAKIAWTYGMRQLYMLSLNNWPTALDQLYFRRTIQTVIRQAGDTDTNAAIVGAFLGAVVGFTKLPKEYLQALLNLRFPQIVETTPLAHCRPSKYEPSAVLRTAIGILRLRSRQGAGLGKGVQ